ncbi:MAG: hypothetical protein IIA66_05525, partial [Planctomycetes bacterium]|nr:hypothetical protein [Planctomycetota bacterium]
ILAQRRKNVASAKKAFLDELASHEQIRYDKDSKQWHKLVLIASKAQWLLEEDKHDTAIEEFKRAQDSILMTIPIHRELTSLTEVDFVDNPLLEVLEYFNDMHGFSPAPNGRFVISIEVTAEFADVPVTLYMYGSPLEDILRKVLEQVSPDIDFVVRNDHTVFILTKEEKKDIEVTWLGVLETRRSLLKEISQTPEYFTKEEIDALREVDQQLSDATSAESETKQPSSDWPRCCDVQV